MELNPALFTIVPLINVLVLVLLFFILSSSFVFQPGISIVPPASSFLLGPQKHPQIVSVVSAPATTIYFRDQRMTVDQLAANLDKPGLADRTLVIRADRSAAYDVVMRIINLGLERGFSVGTRSFAGNGAVNPLSWIFTLSQRARIPYVLVGFLLLSFFIHLVMFYLFRVEYPPSVTITPPPARAVMLWPDKPENRALLQWIDASDPVIFAQSPMADPPLQDLSTFEPSFATRTNEPIISGLFNTRRRVTFPPAIDGITLSMRKEKPGRSTAPPVTPIPPTNVDYDPAIEKRFSGKLPKPKFKQTMAETLMPATFLVGTPSIGEKPLVFLQTSSGDETLDQEAESYIHRLPFSRGKLEWGFVTFYWGPEIFAAPKLPENAS